MRVWGVEDLGSDFVVLGYQSADGEEGFPGRVEARCVYRLDEFGELRLELSASCDASTLVNLAPHGYFNLDGRDAIDRHSLQIAADAYTPVDEYLVPTGAVALVRGSRFDFRRPRMLGGAAYDCNFCLASAPRSAPVFAARLSAGDLAMSIETTEPGLQLYTGDKLDLGVPGLGGRHYRSRAGLCLEPQRWPDAPHHRHFPSILLRPGHSYRQETIYRFEC
jgi:aldose 1-epimerase